MSTDKCRTCGAVVDVPGSTHCNGDTCLYGDLFGPVTIHNTASHPSFQREGDGLLHIKYELMGKCPE